MAVYEPKISMVSITPNPVNINTSFTISVSVSEVEVVMYKVSAVSGTIKSGQSIIIPNQTEVAN